MFSNHQPPITNHQFIDTHAHFKSVEQAKLQIKEANEAGVGLIIAIGSDLQSSILSVQIANKLENIKAAVGIHPHEAEKENGLFEEIAELAKNKEVVAIGETGLDYHYINSPKEIQKELFIKHINLAKKTEKPLIIHSREAMDNTLSILKEKELPESGCLMHCFSGNIDEANELISLGCYLAFGGTITFKNSKSAEVAAKVPLEKIVMETDSPYLSPEPFRGKQNNPANIPIIAKKLAELKDVNVEEISKTTNSNVKMLLNFI